jgi:hypothetical protein
MEKIHQSINRNYYHSPGDYHVEREEDLRRTMDAERRRTFLNIL